MYELTCVSIQRLQVAPLALREQDVEGDGALATAADPGNYREFVARDLDVDVLEVVLAGLVDLDRPGLAPGCAFGFAGIGGVGGGGIGDGGGVLGPQRGASVAASAIDDPGRRTCVEQLSATSAAFGAEVDEPVGRIDDVEVVLDHHQ